MPFIDRPGARVAYTVRGSGPPVILGHSLLCTRSMWDPVLERLEDEYTFINVELRGHGESTATEPFTLWDLVEDWTDILDQEGHAAAACGGLSTGSFTAMRMALKYPERVLGLALFDTDSGPEPSRARYLKYELLGLVYRLTGRIPEGTVSRAMFCADTIRNHPDRVTRFLDELRGFDRRQVALAMHAVFRRQGVELSPVRVPTLVAVGEHDTSTDVDAARRTAAQVAGAELHIIPGAAHLTSVEQPEAVAQLLQDFLPKCVQG